MLTEAAKLIGTGFPDAAESWRRTRWSCWSPRPVPSTTSMAGLRVAIERAERVHLDACTASPPNPVALAEFLAERALHSEYEVFLAVVPDYVTLLGPAGMARYRELVEEAWIALPPSGSPRLRWPQVHRHVADGTPRRAPKRNRRPRRVLSRDVAGGVRHPAHRPTAARGWPGSGGPRRLECGLSDFPPDPRLRRLAAECHVRTGYWGRAQYLRWDNFAESPSVDAYIALRKVVGKRFGALARPRTTCYVTSRPLGKRTDLPTVVPRLWAFDAGGSAAVGTRRRGCVEAGPSPVVAGSTCGSCWPVPAPKPILTMRSWCCEPPRNWRSRRRTGVPTRRRPASWRLGADAGRDQWPAGGVRRSPACPAYDPQGEARSARGARPRRPALIHDGRLAEGRGERLTTRR